MALINPFNPSSSNWADYKFMVNDPAFGGDQSGFNPRTGKRERVTADITSNTNFDTTEGAINNGSVQYGFLSENPGTEWGVYNGPEQQMKGFSGLGAILSNPGFYLGIAGGGIASGLGAFGGAGAAGGVGESVSGFYGAAPGELAGAAASYGGGGAELLGGAGADALGGGSMMPPAVPETPAQLTDWGMTEVSPGNWTMPDIPGEVGGLQGIVEKVQQMPGGGSVLSRIMNGTGTADDWASAAGKLLATGLGIAGASSASSNAQELSQKFQEYGAPYRAQLANISNNPDAFYKGQQATSALEAVLRRLSVGGNPAGDPYKQSLAVNSLFNEYGRERDRLAGFGGLTAYNSAAPGAMANASGSDKGIYDALGYGVNALTSPAPTTLEDLLRKYASGGSSLALA
jgi:hypothetical protein